MAMKPCRECGQQVSTGAKACPHCGKTHPAGGLTLPAKAFLGLVGFVMLVGFISSLSSGGSDTAGSSSPSAGSSPAAAAPAPPDTTFYFVKRLLNASPAEVAAVLGQPDSKLKVTSDCTYLDRCSATSYRNGAYDAEYSAGHLKAVTVLDARINGKAYSPSFLASLNLAGAPSVSNDFNIRWKDLAGGVVEEVVIFPSKPAGIHYALISVRKDRNDRLPIVGSGAMQTESARAQAAADARQQSIDAQFSAWDGSHRGLVAAVKEQMNDPDSFKHVSTQRWPEGDYIRVKMVFRGKNAFGGTVTHTAYARVTAEGQIVKLSIE